MNGFLCWNTIYSWYIQFNWNSNVPQMFVNQRSNIGPVQATVSTTQRRNSNRCDSPFVYVLAKVNQSLFDPFQTRRISPMVLGWKIDDFGVFSMCRGRLVHVRFAWMDLFLSAPVLVVVKHSWIFLFECQRNTFAHHTHAVHGVYQCLHVWIHNTASSFDDPIARVRENQRIITRFVFGFGWQENMVVAVYCHIRNFSFLVVCAFGLFRHFVNHPTFNLQKKKKIKWWSHFFFLSQFYPFFTFLT